MVMNTRSESRPERIPEPPNTNLLFPLVDTEEENKKNNKHTHTHTHTHTSI